MVSPAGRKVSLMDKARIFWRGLWIQGAWSFEGMQTVGFVHTLEPLLEGDDKEKAAAMLRHLELFNTHPFLAPAITAGLASMEPGGEEAVRTRSMLMGPLGGLGDSMFWGALKPLASIVAVALYVEGFTWAPFALVAMFLIPNVGGRMVSLYKGFKYGKTAVIELQKQKPVLWVNRMKLLFSLGMGWVALRSMESMQLDFWGVEAWIAGVGATALALLVAWAVKREVEPMWIVYSAALAAITMGAIT